MGTWIVHSTNRWNLGGQKRDLNLSSAMCRHCASRPVAVCWPRFARVVFDQLPTVNAHISI